ncbi:immunity 63 family protein (plasmid) [Mycobacterium avium subsp. hominissuis]|uniref:Imm63 family immunity protein n=1 Tax=Mycobacterium avium TaxID=1764 RepID=UPI003140A87E
MSRFVIQSAQSGPPGLPSQLPIAGQTVNVLTGRLGAPAFHARLDAPLRFYLDPTFDGRGIAAERLGRDERGPFLWVSEIVMSAHRADEQPYPGMTNFAMDVHAVLAPVDTDPDANEILTTPMALVAVDDAPEAPEAVPGEAAGPPPADAEQRAARPTAARTAAPPAPAPSAGGPATEADVQRSLTQIRGQIATLLGWPLTGIPEPKCVKAGQEKKQGGPAYSVSRGTMRYFTNDLWDGYVLRQTTDVDELLYWIADDVTRSAAWEWTTRTPTFDTVDRNDARRVIAIPMWHTLMHALRYDWGRRTRTNAEGTNRRPARG